MSTRKGYWFSIDELGFIPNLEAVDIESNTKTTSKTLLNTVVQ